jgi:hypothetical protein
MQAQPVINPVSEYTNIVWQATEQNRDITASTTNLFDTAGAGAPPWFLRLLNAFFTEVGSIIAKWIHDFVIHCEAPAASTLALTIQQRVFNPNVAVSNLSGSGFDTIAPQIRKLNILVYTIAQDLLLLMFILSIWKAWTNAHNGASIVSPVIRLAFTAAVLLGWPTISAFIIEISNEMIRAIYPASGTPDAVQLAKGLEAVIDLGIDAAGAALISMLAPLATTRMGGLLFGGYGIDAGNIAGQSISFVAMLIFAILATALIFQLVYIVTMQSAQTVLLYAQYMFAPFFLLFLAHPDTETVATRYIRAVAECSIWSFIWVGLLRLLVIFMTSPLNVWGQILYAVAVFQLMINTPQFVAQAHISFLSEYVSAGLLSRRTIMLIRSFSTQAREHGMVLAKALIKEQNPSTAHKTATSSSHQGSTTSNSNDVVTGQQFDGSWQTTEDAPKVAKPRRRQTKIDTSTTSDGNTSTQRKLQVGKETTGNPAMYVMPELGGLPILHNIGDVTTSASNTIVSHKRFNKDILGGAVEPPIHATKHLPATQSPELSSNDAIRNTHNVEQTSISYGENQQHQIIADANGKLHIKTTPDASDSEICHLHSIAELAKLSFSDLQEHNTQLMAGAVSHSNMASSSNNLPLSDVKDNAYSSSLHNQSSNPNSNSSIDTRQTLNLVPINELPYQDIPVPRPKGEIQHDV